MKKQRVSTDKLVRDDGPSTITGSFIDDQLVARVEMSMHTFAEKANGWRWNIWNQWWCESCAWKITPEQELRVLDYLDDEGWITEEVVSELRARVLKRLNRD